MHYTLVLFASFILNIGALKAQTHHAPTTETGNFNNWLFLHPQVKLNSHWGLAGEIHVRRDDWVKNWRTLLIRPYIDYAFNPKVDIAGGYSYVRDWGVAPNFNPGPSNEHNIWEQVTLHHQLHKLEFSHRYRLEHRFSDRWQAEAEDMVKDGMDFANRFRYRMILKFLLVTTKKEQELYAHIFDEIWIDQYDYLLFKKLSRNWLYLGLGYKFNPKFSVELAYMNQLDWGTNTIETHLLQLSVGYHLDLGKKHSHPTDNLEPIPDLEHH